MPQLPPRTLAWFALVALCGVATWYAAVQKLESWNARSAVTTRTMAVALLNNTTEALFSGTSHFEAAINPNAVESAEAVSLITNAGNYEITEVVLRRHLPQLPGLRAVILEFDVLMLVNDRIAYRRDYVDLYELDLSSWHFPRPFFWRAQQAMMDAPMIRPMMFVQRRTPYVKRWKTNLKPLARGVALLPKQPGHRPYPGTVVSALGGPLVEVLPYTEAEFGKRIERNLRALQRCCRLARQADLQLVLVRTPHHPQFARFVSEDWQAVEERALEAVKQGYGPDFVLWDDFFDHGLSQENFHDAEHVNFRGAETYTQRIDQRLADILNRNPEEKE